ncbi:MAG: DUF4339 domain-containing protein [Hyphomonadaceae bacterium]
MTEAAIEKPESWWVQVRDSAYGPYSFAQLKQFIEEGRVRPNTLVSRERTGQWREVRLMQEFLPVLRPNLRAAGAEPAADANAIANVFIFAEIHSGAWNAFIAALEAMGRIAELAPGFWLVRTRLSSGMVRNTLSQTLERGDRFVVVDATRDRLAWYNMGPGIDVSIREVWNAPLDGRA